MHYKKKSFINILFLSILLSIASGWLGGCTHPPRIYKLDIEQGNKLTVETVKQLKIGMTQEEVHLLLGTPILNSVFRKDYWYYIYHHKPAHKPLQKHHLIIHFVNGKVSEFSQDYYC